MLKNVKSLVSEFSGARVRVSGRNLTSLSILPHVQNIVKINSKIIKIVNNLMKINYDHYDILSKTYLNDRNAPYITLNM